jgi:hypothetical protein
MPICIIRVAMTDIRQSLQYANYLSSLGWTVDPRWIAWRSNLLFHPQAPSNWINTEDPETRKNRFLIVFMYYYIDTRFFK